MTDQSDFAKADELAAFYGTLVTPAERLAENPVFNMAAAYIAARQREKRLEALVRELGKCRSCNGTGRRLPTCFRCDDSTDDHECPGEVDCYGCTGTGLVEAARKEIENG